MMNTTISQRPSTMSKQAETWAALLQRRVMRLLLLHDPQLFHDQFRTFYAGSSLASHPLLQLYDQHIKVLALSEELLDDILPRIHLQWSQHTDHTIVQEENPLWEQVDWQRTLERASAETPGQFPLRFTTHLHHQQSVLPENLLTVAVLLRHQQLVHAMLRIDQQGEMLTANERELLANLEEHVARELARPHIHMLIEEVQNHDLDTLIEQVKTRLPPGSNPYRDLLDWWEHFSALQIGSATTMPRLSLAHRHVQNEQMDRWFYELWLALELITLLHEQKALLADTLTIATDRLAFTFTWHGHRYHFRYQRQSTTSAAITHHWNHIPETHPAYLIERDRPLVVAYKGKTSWQEPPFVVDAAYVATTSDAIPRLLGNMAIYDSVAGLLISPYQSDPQSSAQTSEEARYDQQHYSNRVQETQIELYKITPDMPVTQLQERISAILQYIVSRLPERPQPVCCGVVLDRDSNNASGQAMQGYDVLCPKPHIGLDVYDLVSRERHCLKDPRLCHVIGQVILPPQVNRIANLDDLKLHIEQLRNYGETSLQRLEEENREEEAEQLRSLILQQVGEKIEQYVRMRGNTALQEKFLRDGIFRDYWDQHDYCLEPDTRNILISGEYVWDELQGIQIDDWAAPAVQYCRALEREIKLRLYMPVKDEYKIEDKKWTLGSVKYIYNSGHPNDNGKDWTAFRTRASVFNITPDRLKDQLMGPMVSKGISDLRNELAHGTPFSREKASELRESILGGQGSLLTWVVKNVGKKKV